jgi:hypothetical protein
MSRAKHKWFKFRVAACNRHAEFKHYSERLQPMGKVRLGKGTQEIATKSTIVS